MNYWATIKSIWDTKSPPLNRSEKLYFALGTGLFVFLFLLFFQPFGVNNYNEKETISAEFFIGILCMCLVVMLLVASNELLIALVWVRFSSQKRLIPWIIWSIWYLGTGVFLFYNFLGGWHDLYWRSYLFLVIQLIFFVALFISMYRVQNRNVYYVLLLLWFVHVFGNLLADIAINGDTRFEGDTLGVSISLFWIVLPLSALALLLVFLAIRADQRAIPQSIPWNAKNRKLLWLILGPLPIQAILLATGKADGLTDQIGVILTIVQCFLLPLIVRPYRV